MIDADYEPAIDFLTQFFANTTNAVEIRSLPQEHGAGPNRPRFSRDSDIIIDHCRKWDQPGRAVYFGCCTRITGRPTGARADCAELPALWVDIDCAKQSFSKEDAVNAALSLPIRPSLLIDSGGGIHCYWMLKESIPLSNPGEPGETADASFPGDEAIIAVLRQLAGVLAGDPAVCDLARVMRLPGTHNTKNGELRICRLLSESNFDTRYEFNDLVEMLDVQRPLLVANRDSARNSDDSDQIDDPFLAMARAVSFKEPVDVDARLGAMTFEGDGLAAIHPTRCTVSSSMAARGFAEDQIFAVLLAATHRAAGDKALKWNWKREEAAIWDEIRSAQIKYGPKDNATPPMRSGVVVQLRHTNGSAVAKEEAPSPSDPDDLATNEPTDEKIKAKVATIMATFNARYAVVNEEGRAMVYEATKDERMNRSLYRRITFEDLKKFFLNVPVYLGMTKPEHGKPKPIVRTAADIWLGHRDRKQYLGGVTFDPGNDVPVSVLNLWRGFAVEPAAGSWQLMQDHIFEVICRRDMVCYQFLIGWMARLVQEPARQGEVAVVLRSTAHGAGKGTLARALMRILGQHSMAISNARLLTGAFNGHLRDCVFLFADEAFWAGDKQHLGVLKSLITEPYLTIEAKYQTPVQSPNFIHLMMASNEDWVVPAALTDRRFFVLDVPDIKVQDRPYFVAIEAEMNAGGYEAMLHDLLTRDLSGYDPRAIPQTEGLDDQRSQSLSTIEEWWQTVLHQGHVYHSKLGLEDTLSAWHETVSTTLLYTAYLEFAKSRRSSFRPIVRVHFGRFMRRVGATPTRGELIVGEHVASVETTFGKTRDAKIYYQPAAYGYFLGSIEKARASFVEATKIRGEWEIEAETE